MATTLLADATPRGTQRDWRVSERVRDEHGNAATVRYIGKVASAKDANMIYIGVEWDDVGRGKHDGSAVNKDTGVRVYHFRCAEGAGSFLKPKKLRRGETFSTVLKRRYVALDSAQRLVDEDNRFDMDVCSVQTSKGRQLPVEFHGELKIRKQQQAEDLDRMTVRDEMIALAGDDALDAAPSLASLDMQGNLLSDWTEIAALAKQLTSLTDLRLSGNWLDDATLPPEGFLLDPPDARTPQLSIFPNLKVLVLNKCGIKSWSLMVRLEPFLPLLEQLSVASNDLSDIGPMQDTTAAVTQLESIPEAASSSVPVPVVGFLRLRHLDLSNANITSWTSQVMRLAWLPRLEQLHLNDNDITQVQALEPSSPLEAAAAAASTTSPSSSSPSSSSSSMMMPFNELTTLSLSGSLLDSWRSVDVLETYGARRGGVKVLRFAGTIPVIKGLRASEVRVILIGRLASLDMVNGSIIRAPERVEAEKSYLRRIFRDAARVKEPRAVEALLKGHPRLNALKATYGGAVTGSGSGAVGTRSLALEMVTVTLRSMSVASIEKPPVTKQLPLSLSVKRLKQMCKNLFGLDPALQVLYFEAAVDKTEGPSLPMSLDDDDSTLGLFGLSNHAIVFMNEVDPHREELARETLQRTQLLREEAEERRLGDLMAARETEREAELTALSGSVQNNE